FVEVMHPKVDHPDLVRIPEVVALFRKRTEGSWSSLLLPNGSAFGGWRKGDPRCCSYQTPNALGSCARKNNPPIPATFPIFVPFDSSLESDFTDGAGGLVGPEVACAESCAAMANSPWGRMKLAPAA